MEMDKEKFMEKLKGLMDMGKKKKNMLEYREVTDYFQDMPISVSLKMIRMWMTSF